MEAMVNITKRRREQDVLDYRFCRRERERERGVSGSFKSRGANDGRAPKDEEAATDTRAKRASNDPCARPELPHHNLIAGVLGIGRPKATPSLSRACGAPASQHHGTCASRAIVTVQLADMDSHNHSGHTSNACARRSRPPSPSPTLRHKPPNDTMCPKLKRPARPRCS